ncbi:MAG: hypothetical protein DWP92_08520 [Armatimonadetes bacterium]|nr:MAG: hypothetical protein DWP92_08520 [Armatimonadota bacterium]
MVSFGTPDASWVLLVKPQFEAGKDAVGKGGIVRDRNARHDAVSTVVETYADHGLGLAGLIPSPITGATGNVEYVAWFTRQPALTSVRDLLATIEEPAT